MAIMNRKILLLVATILAATSANVQKTSACTCVPPPPPARAFAEADAVFMGKVISFEFVENGYRRLAQISLVKIWKGDRSAMSEIYTASSSGACGYDFRVGETYVIYAYKDESGRLQTGLCRRTAQVDAATEDLNYLQTQAYYPLSIRNAWTFTQKVTQARYQENIVDSLRLAGQLYYRFDHFREFNSVPIRMSEDGKLFMRLDTTEQMWLDFGANVGDKWPVLAPNGLAAWTVILESQTDTVQVQAGTFVSCFHFHFQFGGADNDWDEWYAPDVGPVKRLYSGIALFEYPLTSAVINDKPLPTSVSDQPDDGPIRAFTLAQNYPNPFAPARNGPAGSTAIRYYLAEASAVTLRIYDMLGREMITLVNRHEPVGEHKALWNGRDAYGNKVPSGIYFYRLQAGKHAEVKKIVLTQ